MEQSAAVYNELDLRELSRQASPVCAVDGHVYDLTLVIESDPSLQELVGCNLDELSGLVDDAEAKVEHIREQIRALNLHPLGNFVSLRNWEQHQASKTDFSKAKCPFASQSREAARCPFAHDRQPALPPMTLKQLNLHNGSTPGLPRLMAFGGVVFNVTADQRSFGENGLFEEVVGKDGTEYILSKFPNASRDDILALFQRQYQPVGRLVAEPEPTAAREQAIELHQHIDDNNVEAIERMFESCEQTADGAACLEALANAVCPRTRLTALHKAVEANRPEIAKLLVIHGASLDAKAQLYDGDTPLQLARRLRRVELEKLLEDHHHDAAASAETEGA